MPVTCEAQYAEWIAPIYDLRCENEPYFSLSLCALVKYGELTLILFLFTPGLCKSDLWATFILNMNSK